MTRHINLLIDTLARYKESASVKFGRGCISKVGLKITLKLGWAVAGNEGNGFSYHISKWIKSNFNMEKRKFRSVHMIHIVFEIQVSKSSKLLSLLHGYLNIYALTLSIQFSFLEIAKWKNGFNDTWFAPYLLY